MQHYFIDKEHAESDFFEFTDKVLDIDLCFRSCDSIFSKNKIDDGTRVLLNTIDKYVTLTGQGLDLGCGYGVIGISLMKKYNIKVDMSDINQTAVELAKQNLRKNNLDRNIGIFHSDGFKNIKPNYDFIITNPPIKTGKNLLFELMTGSYNHLNEQGQLVLVIRKDHGMESLRKHILTTFGNCEILKRDKGYYIIHAIKQK